jgi:hypothetical protein
MTAPPVTVGAVNVAVADASPAVTARPVGAPGVVYGVAVIVVACVPDPAALTARSVRLYDVPFVRLDMVIGDVVCDATANILPASVEYSYHRIADPLVAGAVNASENPESVDVAASDVGVPGTVYGVTVVAVDAEPVPPALTARTATLYAVPLVRPEMVSGEAV